MDVARDDGVWVGEDVACVEILQVNVTAGVGDFWDEPEHLVIRLFGDRVSAKAYCSRAPLKLDREFSTTSMAFVIDLAIHINDSGSIL